MDDPIAPLILRARIERWPFAAPFRIAGFLFEAVDVLVVELEKDGRVGTGEGAGVYYKDDRPAGMLRQIQSLRSSIETGISRAALQQLLPPGGARNALDCALWDLEAKLTARHAWQIAGLAQTRPLLTTFTCGADDPQRMAAVARSYTDARAIKIKLTGEPIDVERVCAVREARPNAWLGVDANQGFTRASLERLMPTLLHARIALIEQPFPIGLESFLDGFESAIPIFADESVQQFSDLSALAGRFQGINIKLDKCGGLTEALAMARVAHNLGLKPMVGNMFGTSLAMAPAFVVGQLCHVVDLDGPVFLKTDRAVTAVYADGNITCPQELWG